MAQHGFDGTKIDESIYVAKTRKSELLETMRNSITGAETNKTFVKLFIQMPTGEIEIIQNPNISAKAAYIENAYDDELHLKSCPDIYIADYEIHEDYRKGVSFSDALVMLKQGMKVARKGWNGKKRYIELATNVSYVNANNEVINVDHKDMGNRAIAFVGTSGVQLGWLASQADMLSDDWEIFE